MLKVIVGLFSKEQKEILTKMHNAILITDLEIYNVLNGEDETIDVYFDDYEKLVDAIYEQSKTENIILHTFNPLIHNYFEDEVAIESFFFFNNKTGDLEKLFDNEKLKRKLNSLAPGDAITDVFFREDVLNK